jgi:hypothetical protein
VHADPAVNPWAVRPVTLHRGGPVIVPRSHAPLARPLPYRRAAGEPPPHPTHEQPAGCGWTVILGDRGLGDTLLALALARALAEGTGKPELRYEGPRPRLFQRCLMPMTTVSRPGPHAVHAGAGTALTMAAVPEEPCAWLDILDEEYAEVHASLPMRYYLAAEQALGVRLPADRAPVPAFASAEHERPFDVVFVTATSWPGRKDYGTDGYAAIARAIEAQHPGPWQFTMITSSDSRPSARDGIEVVPGPDAVDCLDLFASARLVIGNDTGLTHLAALTQRPDGSGPEVIGLYGRHAYSKWTTGAGRHHAVATPFSQMLALADRCPVRDQLDDAAWAGSASLSALPADCIAAFAMQVAELR